MKEMENDQIETEVDESQEDEANVTYDIATYPSDFTLSGIVEMWNNKDIAIPEFQREFVWKIKQSSLLIESFLLGLPVPPVFFYIDDENKNLVIDGQQRLLSIVFFFSGFFGFENMQGKKQVFRLQGLDESNPYHNKTFNDLPVADQRKLKNTVLRAINIRQLSPVGESTSVYHIFERLNTGGTPLSPQEIRNVAFRGEIVQVLRELNADANWRKILGQDVFNKRQVDVELVLRTLAFMNGFSEYEKPMKEFLNNAMNRNRKGATSEIKKFRKIFPNITSLAVKKLGERPFHLRGRLNTAVLDAVLGVLFQHYPNVPEDFSERYKRLIEDPLLETYTTLGTTDTSTVKERHKLAKKYLID